MRKIYILVSIQALLCWLEAYLISKISLIGKFGIAIFYKEYKILRSGWKTFLFFFATQVLLIAFLYIISKRFPKKPALVCAAVIVVVGLAGLWSVYEDFQHTYFHRLLKERFHLGFYLFWLSWLGSCIYFMVVIKMHHTEPQTITETSAKEHNQQTL
jgi:Na+/melibiose symporter-like transporter